MKSGGPWSVKGIEPAARETAKTAARKAGKTLGEWLNQVILESGQPDASEAAALLKDPELWENLEGRAPWSEALEDLASKLDASEKHHQTLLSSIDQAISRLAERVNAQDTSRSGNGGGSGPTAEISRRLSALEEHSKRSLSKDNLKSIESAMTQVAGILDTNNKKHEDRFQAFDESFSELRARLAETESKVTDALGRIEASFDANAADELHDKIVTTFTEDLADIDERILAAQERSEQTFEQVQHNISDIVSQLNESSARIDAALDAPLEAARKAVAEITQKVDAQSKLQETRTAELEKSLAELSTRIETPQEPKEDPRVAVIETRLEDFNARLERAQEEQSDALSQIRASLEAISSRLNELDETVTAKKVETAEPEQAPQSFFDKEPESQDTPTFETAPQPEPRSFGLRKKSVAEAVRDSEAADDFGDDAPTEFDQLVQSEATPSAPEEETKDPEPQAKPSKLGWAARAFRKSEPIDDVVEPYGSAETDDVEPETEETPDETNPDVSASFFEQAEPAGPEAGAEEVPEPVASLEDMLRNEGPTSSKSRQRKSVDDYFNEGPINPSYLDSRDEELKAPRQPDEASPLNDMRNDFFSQADGEADRMRGALSEIIEPEREHRRRRTLLWVICGLVMALMVIGSVLILSGSAKDILSVDGRPDLLQDIQQSFKSLVGSDTSPAQSVTDTKTEPSTAPDETGSPPGSDENASTSDSGTASAKLTTASHIGSPNYFQVAEVMPAEGLEQAAKDGNAKAQYALALAYANGTVVAQDQQKAVQWYRAAAEQGLAPAQYWLAARLEQGSGTQANPAEAITWYLKAANGGNRNAMHNLAVAYAQGNATPQDLNAAAQWFEKAASLGLADAQFNLGLLYARGLGVEQNDVEAYKWFALAQKSGGVDAQAQLDTLQPKLTTGDLNYIDLYVESWAAKPFDPIANGQFDVAPEAYSDRARRAIIARAQALLQKLGFHVAAVDGIIDPSTQEAVRSFQALSNLPTTGAISSETLLQLESQTP